MKFRAVKVNVQNNFAQLHLHMHEIVETRALLHILLRQLQ